MQPSSTVIVNRPDKSAPIWVTPKAGGPVMTVVAIADDKMTCMWLDDKGQVCEAEFPPSALKEVD